MTKKLVLIDGNSIIYRAFFALPLLNNDKGVYTNAVYGFTTMLMRILKEQKPTHLLVAFDAGKTTFRHKTYKEYKGGRQKTPSELSEQFPVMKELLDAFGITHYQLDQYEADDIIGTLSKAADKDGFEVSVISGDKDLLQLVTENVTVNVTKKGISEMEAYTPAYMWEKMGISPAQIIDLKGLMGDSSDNIPGVPGVGEKTAAKLLKQFHNVEKVYEHIDEVSGKKLKEKLTAYQADALMSKKLATIDMEAPITVHLKDTIYANDEPARVSEMFKDLGFESLLVKLGNNEEEPIVETLKDIDFTIVKDVKDEMFTGQEALMVGMLEENYHKAPVLGFGIANKEHTYFIPPETAFQSEIFQDWIMDETKKKVMFDSKTSLVALLQRNMNLQGVIFDTVLASYLLNPSENNHSVGAIARRLQLSGVHYDEEVYGKGAKQKIPHEDILAEHIARKARMLYDMHPNLDKQLQDNQQEKLLKDLEMPLAHILGEMEHTGVSVDKSRLEIMGKELKERLGNIEKQIFDLAGETFNLNSPKQLGPILFEKLKLPVIKKTKTGYSTAADVLEQLQHEHDIIPKILLYRQLGKLQSTYIEGLLKVVHQDSGKIHTRYNQALTQTGRLSSIDPNLQNIPIRLEEGRKIRQAFVPSEKDWIMFSADYSQIELRVLAHIAEDEKLITAFKQEKDIHTSTAMEVFHVDEAEVTSNMRRQAKAVNFGIVYGISDYGLSQNLGITRKEAKQFIERYFRTYPDVKKYMEDIVSEAKHQGYVKTFMNRRRYLPDINSRNFNKRSFAERTAMNTPIQGSAADIIKQAMLDLHRRLVKEKMTARMLLQVHDELILEAPKEELDKLKIIVPECMENTIALNVPLKVEYAYGNSWFDAK